MFAASLRVAAALRMAAGFDRCVYPLSAGYVQVSLDQDPERAAHILPVALDHGRTVVLTNGGTRAVRLRQSLGDGRQLSGALYAVVPIQGSANLLREAPSELSPGATGFVLPAAFLGPGRTAVPTAASVVAGLTVTLLGVGPAGEAPLPVRSSALHDAEHVIVFDRIRDRVLEGVTLRGTLHIASYVYSRFDSSAEAVQRLVDDLERAGARSIAIAVEGNPEVLDLAPWLAHASRELKVIPARPIALQGSDKVARAIGRPLIDGSYALVSGLPRRHLLSSAGLRHELSGYLGAGLGCVLLEMYRGDLGVVADAAARLDGRRTIAILSNLFSPTERIELFQVADGVTKPTTLMRSARGELTTVVISAPGSDR